MAREVPSNKNKNKIMWDEIADFFLGFFRIRNVGQGGLTEDEVKYSEDGLLLLPYQCTDCAACKLLIDQNKEAWDGFDYAAEKVKRLEAEKEDCGKRQIELCEVCHDDGKVYELTRRNTQQLGRIKLMEDKIARLEERLETLQAEKIELQNCLPEVTIEWPEETPEDEDEEEYGEVFDESMFEKSEVVDEEDIDERKPEVFDIPPGTVAKMVREKRRERLRSIL